MKAKFNTSVAPVA